MSYWGNRIAPYVLFIVSFIFHSLSSLNLISLIKNFLQLDMSYFFNLDPRSTSFKLKGISSNMIKRTNPILCIKTASLFPCHFGHIGRGFCSVTYCKKDHDLITNTKILGIKRIGPHNIDILSILFGSLLGDAYAERRDGGAGTRITFEQAAVHINYGL